MTYIKMNEILSKYTKDELETKVKELSNQGMKRNTIYRSFGVTGDTFRRHMAILNNPEEYVKKQVEYRKQKRQLEANEGSNDFKNGDRFWQDPKEALRKFQEEFKEMKSQRTLQDLRDPYHHMD